MRYSVMVADKQFTLDVEQGEDQQWHATLDGTSLVIDRAQINPGHFSLRIGARSYEIFVRPLPTDGAPDAKGFEVLLDGLPQTVEVVDERRHVLAGLAKGRGVTGEVTVKAPMPGLVAQVLVQAGDTVERGQRVVVLEAMKMQNDLLSPRGGIVRAVKTSQGEAVNLGQPLVIIGDPAGQQPPESEEEEAE